jgi:chemosensory pili system protein ChpA (sensor histidine kinase/response regulator)
MNEYLLPGALVLLLVVLLGARALQRRGGRRARSAAPDSVSRGWQRASSLFEMVRPARQTQPELGDEELRAQREAAEEAARLEGDREAAEWEVRLAAELQARLSPEAPAQPDPTSQPEQPKPPAQSAPAEPAFRASADPMPAPLDLSVPMEFEPIEGLQVAEIAELPPIPAPDTASQPLAAAMPPQPTVMIAEPSKVVRIKTSRLLEKHGYRVVLAVDGFDAVQQIDEVMPHALIIGVEIPGLDGFQLATHLRGDARTAQLPIVMISGDDDRLRDQADQAGINVLLGKPYSEEQLLAYLDSIPAVAQTH